jgi:hypothetical protein
MKLIIFIIEINSGMGLSTVTAGIKPYCVLYYIES